MVERGGLRADPIRLKLTWTWGPFYGAELPSASPRTETVARGPGSTLDRAGCSRFAEIYRKRFWASCTEWAGAGAGAGLGLGLQAVSKQRGWSFLHPAAAARGCGQRAAGCGAAANHPAEWGKERWWRGVRPRCVRE